MSETWLTDALRKLLMLSLEKHRTQQAMMTGYFIHCLYAKHVSVPCLLSLYMSQATCTINNPFCSVTYLTNEDIFSSS